MAIAITELAPHREVLAPQRELGKFLSRMWNHPLLDLPTIQHRKNGQDVFLQFLRNYSLNPDLYLALPVGSTIWTVDESSDHDMIVVAKNEQARQNLQYAFHAKYGKTFVPNGLGLHTTTEERIKAMTAAGFSGRGENVNYGPLLFLTPDSQITGDLDWAAQLRLSLLDTIEHSNTVHTFWDGESSLVRETFRRTRDWRLIPHEDQKRGRRFSRALDARSERSFNPERYREAFLRTLVTTDIPPFSVAAQEIRANNGRLAY